MKNQGEGLTGFQFPTPGDRVEVRTRFDARWAHGFEVAEVTDGGYRLRRLSDGEVLPTEFDVGDLRREGRSRYW